MPSALAEDKRVDGGKEWGKCLHSLSGVGGGGINRADVMSGGSWGVQSIGGGNED